MTRFFPLELETSMIFLALKKKTKKKNSSSTAICWLKKNVYCLPASVCSIEYLFFFLKVQKQAIFSEYLRHAVASLGQSSKMSMTNISHYTDFASWNELYE